MKNKILLLLIFLLALGAGSEAQTYKTIRAKEIRALESGQFTGGNGKLNLVSITDALLTVNDTLLDEWVIEKILPEDQTVEGSWTFNGSTSGIDYGDLDSTPNINLYAALADNETVTGIWEFDEYLRIKSTSTGAAQIELRSASVAGGAYMRFKNSLNATKGEIGYTGLGDELIINNELNEAIEFHTNNTERVTISASGNLVANNDLTVGGDFFSNSVTSSTSNGNLFLSGAGSGVVAVTDKLQTDEITSYNTGEDLTITGNGAGKVQIDDNLGVLGDAAFSGDVNVGDGTTTSIISILGGNAGNDSRINYRGNGATYFSSGFDQSLDQFVINNGVNFSGTSVFAIDRANGDATFGGDTYAAGGTVGESGAAASPSPFTPFIVNRNTANVGIMFEDSGGDGSFYYSGTDDTFITSSNMRIAEGDSRPQLEFEPTGSDNWEIQVNSAGFLVRNTTEGTTDVTISQTGDANFAGDLTAANFESGTFTPVLADASTSGNTATGIVNGRYVRNGDMVTVFIKFVNMTTSGLTGGNDAYIRDLPFTVNAAIEGSGTASINSTTFASGYVTSFAATSSTYLRLKENTSGANIDYVTCSELSSGNTDIYVTMTYYIGS